MKHEHRSGGRAVALSALLGQPTFGQWQPIDTAPIDGTRILSYWPQTCVDDDGVATGEIIGHVIGTTSYAAGWYEPAEIEAAWCDDEAAFSDAPTHWMPLPLPPNAELTGVAAGGKHDEQN